MVRFRVLTLTVIFTLFVLVATGMVTYLQLKETVGKNLVLEIPWGDNLTVIAGRLSEQHALPCHKAFFQVLGRLTAARGQILAGQYRVRADMTALDLLGLFRSGNVIQHRLTFPEGWTLAQWRNALKEAPHLASTTEDLNNKELARLLGGSDAIEGWLFPDTYQYVKGDLDLDILERAHSRMQSILTSEWEDRLVTDHLRTKKDALILASIIEKETGEALDRAKIASVFHNRLALGMKLQSDPTVIYGLGEEFDGDLTRSHLVEDNPYNTYTRYRLPPGAICSPGRASIKAAMAGSKHSYLYFVAKGDGQSYFSMNLSEHNRAVARYQSRAK